jgi:hypothetical protein
MASFGGGAIKLSPGVDFESLPTDVQSHLELISEEGSVVQAVLYVGRAAEQFSKGRTATVLSRKRPTFSMTAVPERPVPARELPAVADATCLYEVDGAITRAGLAAPLARSLSLVPVTIDGGYLFSKPGEAVIQHAALTGFEVLAVIPFSERRTIEQLQLLGARGEGGPVEVKTRGLPEVDTDLLQRSFTKAAPTGRTVLLFRHGQQVVAVFANRLRPAD